MSPLRLAALAAALSYPLSTPLTAATESGHRFRVESYASPHAVSRHLAYRIVDTNLRGLAADDVTTADARRLLQNALAARGMYEAPASDMADVEVTLNLLVTDRRQPDQEAYVRFRPTTRHVRKVDVVTKDDDGNITRQRKHALVPIDYGYTSRNVKGMLVYVYDKVLDIAAREVSPENSGRRGREVWRVEIRNSDACGKAETYFPLMLSVAVDAIGARKTGDAEVVLTMHDQRVELIEQDS